MDYLERVNKYCDLKVINNIKDGYKKIVGIESDLNITADNKKNVGIVCLLDGLIKNKKIKLDVLVQFNSKKIKWQSSNYDDNLGFYLIDPFFVKPYEPIVKIEVPVKVYDAKSEQTFSVMTKLTFNQFMKNRLLEFYGEYQHRYIAAYDNFNYLLKNNQYFYAINSTVKHYKIPQDKLLKVLSTIDNEKKRIKARWFEYMNIHIQKDQFGSFEKLMNKLSSRQNKNNVIKLKK